MGLCVCVYVYAEADVVWSILKNGMNERFAGSAAGTLFGDVRASPRNFFPALLLVFIIAVQSMTSKFACACAEQDVHFFHSARLFSWEGGLSVFVCVFVYVCGCTPLHPLRLYTTTPTTPFGRCSTDPFTCVK